VCILARLPPDPMCDDVDPGPGDISTECRPVYPWNAVLSFGTSCVGYGLDGTIDDDCLAVPPSDIGREISFICGRSGLKTVDLVDAAHERRRR
jgi:hypothetical protein